LPEAAAVVNRMQSETGDRRVSSGWRSVQVVLRFLSRIPPSTAEAIRRVAKDLTLKGSLRERILASGLFDPAFYLARYPDVASAGEDPTTHYLRHGGKEGRQPSAAFDAEFYLGANADVRKSKVNPLVHYISHGQREGRPIRSTTVAPPPVAPPAVQWKELAGQLDSSPKTAPVLDIIVPVYRGFDETANCLYSLVRSRVRAAVPCEIVVVDDASPDHELSHLLNFLAAHRLITLLRNERNQGFVASINRAVALHAERDVVILNADTEVYGDWVERLRRAAYSEEKIGTATPFSNNGTFCGYPHIDKEFHGTFEVSFAEIDRIARATNATLTADIPAARGFCMYVRRECLREFGLFDVETFGLGYGEETDFSLRIAARGWRNVLAADVFVRHIGRVSFGSATHELATKGLAALEQRYPGFTANETNYVETDPLRSLRRNIDVVRLRRAAGERAVLHVLHFPFGGTMKHVLELARLLAQEGIGAFLLRPWPGDDQFTELSHLSINGISAASRVNLNHDLASTAELFQRLGIFHIHVHHFMGFPREAMQFIETIARMLGIGFDFTAHDYFPVCPRGTMIEGNGLYCDNSDPRVCNVCVAVNGSPFGRVDVQTWRAGYGQFLARARRGFVPSEDAKLRLGAFFPSLEITVRQHPEPVSGTLASPVLRKPGEPLRVAVIGVIRANKGSRQIYDCARDAARRRLPIKFVLFGFDQMLEISHFPTVDATALGRYDDGELPDLLADAGCHLSFFPSVWPETYCYTLSQAFFAGLYPVAFDLGAIAERIRNAGWGQLLPFEMVRHPAAINDALLSCRVPPLPARWHPVAGASLYTDMLGDYYGLR